MVNIDQFCKLNRRHSGARRLAQAGIQTFGRVAGFRVRVLDAPRNDES